MMVSHHLICRFTYRNPRRACRKLLNRHLSGPHTENTQRSKASTLYDPYSLPPTEYYLPSSGIKFRKFDQSTWRKQSTAFRYPQPPSEVHSRLLEKNDSIRAHQEISATYMCERYKALILPHKIYDAAATVTLRRAVCSICLVDLHLSRLSSGYF